MLITVDLWKHQQEMVDFAEASFNERGYAWWIAGCRTGKTLASLKLIELMGFTRSLIITKKSAIGSAWASDIEDHIVGLDVLYLDTYVSGTGVKRKKMNSKQKAETVRDFVNTTTEGVVIVNYETAKLIADTLQVLDFDYVVLDESHLVKTHNSQVSVTLAKKLSTIPCKLLMTGTAWDDRPTDVYGQVRFLENTGKGRYPASTMLGNWGTFFETYVNYWQKDNIKIAQSYKNVDRIVEIINPFTMRIDTEDVLDLPPKRNIDLTLTMPSKMRKAYKDLEDTMIAELGDDLLIIDNVITLGLRLHQLTGGYYPNEDGTIVEYLKDKDNPKLSALLDIVSELDGSPLVVFTRFKHDVVLIERALNKVGVTTAKLTGDVQEHVEWQREASAQVLIANIQAGGTGVTLSRARHVVYYSIGHSRTDYTQSEWRIRDNNSDKNKPVVYHNLMIDKSIDVIIRNSMRGKKEVSDELLEYLSNRLTTAN